MYSYLLKCISFLAGQDHSFGKSDRRERAELSKEQPAAPSQGRQVIGNFALLHVYSHVGHIPAANTQMQQQMRLHKNFNSDILHFEFILGESLASSTII
jgi:hypothetical protein